MSNGFFIIIMINLSYAGWLQSIPVGLSRTSRTRCLGRQDIDMVLVVRYGPLEQELIGPEVELALELMVLVLAPAALFRALCKRWVPPGLADGSSTEDMANY